METSLHAVVLNRDSENRLIFCLALNERTKKGSAVNGAGKARCSSTLPMINPVVNRCGTSILITQVCCKWRDSRILV